VKVDAYDNWERYGTNLDVRGKVLEPRDARPFRT
jgi:hypothetical protein